jgi:hypothetical protein
LYRCAFKKLPVSLKVKWPEREVDQSPETTAHFNVMVLDPGETLRLPLYFLMQNINDVIYSQLHFSVS